MLLRSPGWPSLLLALAVMFQTPAERPRPSVFVEQAGSSLAQLDITLLGPADHLATITAADLVIRIQGVKVKSFTLDRLCDTESSALADPQRKSLDEPKAVAGQRGSYLLFFDQQQLTQSGRHRAIRTARELVMELAGSESQVMLVSNAAKIKVVQPFTNDSATLLRALDELAEDRKQWDWMAQGEESRVGDVIRTLNDADDLHRAIGMARSYQKEELWRSNRSFRRLGLSLAALQGGPTPRAVIYFADTIRSNPGQHYLSFFGTGVQEEHAALSLVASGAEAGGLAYDDVVNKAAAHGIRVYMIQSEGLVSGSDPTRLSSRAATATLQVGNSSMVRIRDTQRTMRNMARETGGEAFLNGIQANKILDRLREDASCVFLASIPTDGLALDRPLRIDVKVKRPGIRSRVRGRLVLQSAKARQRSRLLQAFSAPGTLSDLLDIEVNLIPLDFEQGEFRGLLQIRVPAVEFPGATWDVGASVVSREKVREELSRRVTLPLRGVPLIVEHEILFRPGDTRIVAVAQEARTGLLASREIVVRWPDPHKSTPGLGPIAILQPIEAVFVRGEQTRTEGSASTGGANPLFTDRPTALIGFACRGRGKDGANWTVERSLSGLDSVEYEPIMLPADAPRCAQIRDLMPADRFNDGQYEYRIRLVRNGQTIDSAVQGFQVQTR